MFDNPTLTPVMALIKPTLDDFMKSHAKVNMTDELREKLAKTLDKKLVQLGYDERLVRVLEPQANGDTVVLVFTRDEQDKKDKKFTITTITVRGDVTPEELKQND
jgi:hypothetical protein